MPINRAENKDNTNSNNSSIGKRVKDLREFIESTQAEFANSINISRSMLSQIETDKTIPTYSTIYKICNTFNIQSAYFFDDGAPEVYKYAGIVLKYSGLKRKGHEHEQRIVNLDELKQEVDIQKYYGALVKRFENDLSKEDSELYELYKTLEQLMYVSEAVSNFIEALSFDNSGNEFQKSYFNQNPQQPPSYNRFKESRIEYLRNTLAPHKHAIFKLYQSLMTSLGALKDLDTEENLWMIDEKNNNLSL